MKILCDSGIVTSREEGKWTDVYKRQMLWGLKAEDAALHISQVWGYAAVPVGCGLQIFRSIVSIVQSARKLQQPPEETAEGGAA